MNIKRFLLFSLMTVIAKNHAFSIIEKSTTLIGHRYRDLDTGTFLTPDPLGFVDGPNRYTYVRQSPWTNYDPTGLYAKATRSHAEDGQVQLLIELPMTYVQRNRDGDVAVADFDSPQIERSARAIQETWSGDFGKYQVTTVATKGDTESRTDTTNYVALLTHEEMKKTRAGRAHVTGPRNNITYLDPNDGQDTLNHEVGHLMGMPDRYNTKSGTPGYNLPFEGWEGNIMAERSGEVESRNFDDMLQVYSTEAPYAKAAQDPNSPVNPSFKSVIDLQDQSEEDFQATLKDTLGRSISQ